MKSSRARRNSLALAGALLAAALPALAAHGPGFVPKTKFVQVVRYLFRGASQAPKPPRLPEVSQWRSTMTVEGAALDAKIIGPSLQVAGAAVRRVDEAMLSRVPPPERVVISSMSTLNAYKRQHRLPIVPNLLEIQSIVYHATIQFLNKHFWRLGQ